MTSDRPTCPECKAPLDDATRCPLCGWRQPAVRPVSRIITERREPYQAPAPEDVKAFMAEVRRRLGVTNESPEPAPNPLPTLDSCGHASPEECERDAEAWFRWQARRASKPRDRR